jgi:GDP-L-fucose synthase
VVESKSNNNIRCLVTGATGFLGKHLTKKLEEQGFEIYISNTVKANLMSVENLYIYNNIEFDYIFHLAAVTKAGDYCLTHPADQWLSNQAINTNILNYWKNKQPQAKMICMGTSCSYSPGTLMTEENYLLGEPEASLHTYAMTKRMLLLGLQALQKQYGLRWLYFIPSTLFGPGFELDDNHFIFDFIRNGHNTKEKGETWSLWGDGKQRRELIYIEDAIDAMIELLSYDNEVFNLGSGQDYTINEFAQKVCEIYDYDFKLIEHDMTKYVGVKEKKIDTTKVISYLKGKEFLKTPLQEGLKKSIKYFKENI